MGDTQVCSVSIEGLGTANALIVAVRAVTDAGYAICGIEARHPDAKTVQFTLLTPVGLPFQQVVERLTRMGLAAE